MSALSSKHTSKANIAISINNNDPKSTHRNKQKHQKTASKYSSSALSNKHSPMQLAFQKPGEKVKKNLSKQFQTFNINNQDKQITFHKEGAKNNVKNIGYQKVHGSKTKTEITTQVKSPLVKSNLSSKTKLSHFQQKQEISQLKSNVKQSIKKQRQRSRSESQQSSNRSQNPSPRVSPSYSKLSDVSSKQRAFSKPKFQNPSNISQKSQNKDAFLKNKSQKQVVKSSSGNDYHINFPLLITQSQSVENGSSYPNTGKESLNFDRLNYSKEEERDNNNRYILQEEDESEYIQSQETDEDEHLSSHKVIAAEPHKKIKPNNHPHSTYHQLPQSYITAMQILQQTIQSHQLTITNLHKQLHLQQTAYTQLQNHCTSLQHQLTNKQAIINEKDAEIRFLKGYLDEEKSNNRQALREVARNVYERVVAKKDNKMIDNNEQQQNKRKQKRRLFANDTTSKKKDQNQQAVQQAKPEPIQKLIQPQQIINHQQQIDDDALQRQLLLKQQLHKQQQLVKDELMRFQILRQQAQLRSHLQQKRYHQYHQLLQHQLQSGFVNKRDRVMSTAIKASSSNQQRQRQVGQTTYRGRNLSVNNGGGSSSRYSVVGQQHSNRKVQQPSQNRTPLTKPHPHAADPVLQRYIPQSIIEQNRLQLKTSHRNKSAVSKMRQLMRAQKQLIALNYKLEAVEKRILEAVQSQEGKGKGGNDSKTKLEQKGQGGELGLLEELRRQYAVVKKEVERKEIVVKQLKGNLQADG